MQETLTHFLRSQWPDADEITIEDFAIISGGYSEETFRFDCRVRRDASEQVLPMILRKDPDPLVDILPTSREREHYVLKSLAANTEIPVCESHFVLDAAHLGHPAMLIERVPGSGMVSELFHGGPNAHMAEGVATDLCEYIAELHLADVAKLDPEGRLRDPRGGGIDTSSWDRYMDTTYDWYIRGFDAGRFCPMPNTLDTYLTLRRNRPRPLRLSVLHGDFNPSNFLYDNGRVVSVIDWENAHIGDPREDLGWMKHMDVLSNTDIFGSVKKDGGFLGHYNRITGFGVTDEEIEYFRLFGSSHIAMGVLVAMKRRMDKEHTELLTMYIIQPVVGSMLAWAQLTGYPMPAMGGAQ
ncbi:MAG: phosphotransferase family protein [Dehalococcoidia bacterium]|nr:phosphotransferase family protein [Dehalococcoidia bacterium]